MEIPEGSEMVTQGASEMEIQMEASDREIRVVSGTVTPEALEMVIPVDSVILFLKQDLTIIISNHHNLDIITAASETEIPEASDLVEAASIPEAEVDLEEVPAAE